MASKEDEEKQVGSVPLQNTQSMLLPRRRAEDAVRKHAEWLRITLDSIGDGVICTDAGGRVSYMNGVAEQLTGWSRPEASGRPLPEIFNIVNDRTLQSVDNPALRSLQEGAIVGLANHTILIARDGTRRPIDDSAAPMRWEGQDVVGAVLVFRDISERKQADAVKARLAAIVESSEDAIVSKTLDGIILSWNKGAEHLFGYTSQEAVAQPITLIIPPERYDEERGILEKIRRGERLESFETVRVAKDGRRLDISLTISPIRDDEGRVIGTSKIARDITERKRAERALRESHARNEAIVKATPECVKVIDRTGKLLEMNPAGLAMIEADEQSALGQSVYSIIAPEYRDAFREFNERICRGESGRMDLEFVGLRGTRRHMESNAVPIAAPEGGFLHLAVSRDVTETALAARVLAENRARLDYAVKLSGVGFWYCDLPFFELIWDARVKEHFWLPADARVTIETFYERLHPDDREPTRRAIETCIRRRKPYDVDYRTVDPDSGAIKWIRAIGGTTYLEDGTPSRFDGVTVDATDRKVDEIRLSHALQREREQGRLLRLLPEAALTIHSSGSLDSVLRAIAEEARRILCAQRAVSCLTVGDDFVQTINTESGAQKDEHRLWKGLESVLATFAAEVCRTNRPMLLPRAELEANPGLREVNQTGNRGVCLTSWLAAPFISRKGKNLGLIQVSNKDDGDFSEIDEAALVQLAHIASVAIENARLYGELRDQDRRKDEFLALLAHELRNPLAPLRNGLQVIRLAEHDPGAMMQALEMMERQLAHMVRLVDDLLDVSRISRNKMELRRSRVLLADVVSGAVETSRPAIESAGHELTISLPAQPICLDADLTRLAQVFGNLLTNSAKYTERGGRIWLTAERRGNWVSVVVRDTGIGIPAYALPNIFDMFSQVDRSIERSTGGLGIGLALVKGLVEMHGGTVAVISPGQGKGTTFTVRLPVLENPLDLAASEATDDSTRTPGQKRRILVVDDNRDSAISMAMMLKLLGNEVRSVHDGLEAVEAAEAFRPQVILMDVGMPRLNGYDATRRIREQSWGRDTIIIALTGWGQEVDRAQSKEVGCNGHLVKPVHLPDLQNLLNELSGEDGNCTAKFG